MASKFDQPTNAEQMKLRLTLAGALKMSTDQQPNQPVYAVTQQYLGGHMGAREAWKQEGRRLNTERDFIVANHDSVEPGILTPVITELQSRAFCYTKMVAQFGTRATLQIQSQLVPTVFPRLDVILTTDVQFFYIPHYLPADHRTYTPDNPYLPPEQVPPLIPQQVSNDLLIDPSPSVCDDSDYEIF